MARIFVEKFRREEKLVNTNGVPIPPTPQQLVVARYRIAQEFTKPAVREMVVEAFDLITSGCSIEEVPLRMKRRTAGTGDAVTLAYGFCRDYLNGFSSFREIQPQTSFRPAMANTVVAYA